jgi:hypothetical protein
VPLFYLWNICLVHKVVMIFRPKCFITIHLVGHFPSISTTTFSKDLLFKSLWNDVVFLDMHSEILLF